MVCPRCGRTVPDGAQCPCSGGVMYSSNPAVNILKSVGASTMFLVLAILQTVSVVFAVINSIVADSGVMDLVYNFGYEYGWNYFLDEIYYDPSFSASSIVGAIIGAVFPILTAVALWLFHTASKNISDGGVSTTGISMLKVVKTIEMIAICVVFGFLIVVFVIVGAAAGVSTYEYGYGYGSMDGAAAAVILIVISVILAVILVPVIIYYVSVIRMLKRIRTTAETGMPDNRISGFVIVMLYIFAGLTIISGLFSLTAGALSAISQFVLAAVSILEALCLSNYKKQMTALIYNPPIQTYPQTPSYPGAQPYAIPAPPQNIYTAPPVQTAPVPPQAPVQPAESAPAAPATPSASPADMPPEENKPEDAGSGDSAE